MKRQQRTNLRRPLNVLTENKGESLLESSISILIFSIYVAVIAAVLAASSRMTGISTARAAVLQQQANSAIFEVGTNQNAKLTIKGAVGGPGASLSVDMTVKLTENSDFVSFRPGGWYEP